LRAETKTKALKIVQLYVLFMYYKSKIQGIVRIRPEDFGKELKKAISKALSENYEGRVNDVLGIIISIEKVNKINEGVLIPGDGGAYYKVEFEAIHYIPEINEIIEGEIRDIAKFGAFIDFGPFEGMVHLSQTMDDFVSLSKQGTLQGKNSKKNLKKGDKVRARIIAVSLKDPESPKIGLTMRQQYLGKLDWIEEERIKEIKTETPKGNKKQS